MSYKDKTHWRAFSLAALSVVAVALCGCRTDEALFQSDNVDSRDQAAGVLISVTSVAPWSQVSDAMAPNFTLANGDAALSQVAPVTERLQSQVLNAFGVTLGLGLPQTSTLGSVADSSSNSNTLSNTNGVVTTAGVTTNGTTSTQTTTTTPGTAPQVQTTAPAGASLPTAAGITGDIGIDPILKYQAALALYQEVQLLNRQIQNAAIDSCDVPYLVQLKLAVMPYRRHLPYDMHARISFFPSSSSQTTPITPKVTETAATTNASSKGEMDTQSAEEAACNNSTNNPRILPLLVTDDIQQAMTSRAVDAAKQIGLALAAMVHGVGANVGFNSDSQSVQAVSGADLNSTLTVARQTENTLYVRIGAAYEGTAGYALVGQTHDISAILLVPKRYIDAQPKGSATSLHVIVYSEFRNATNGKPLNDRSTDTLLAQEDIAMKRYLAHAYDPEALPAWNELNDSQKAKVVDTLLAEVQWNNFDDFKRLACDFGDVSPNVSYHIFPSFDCTQKGSDTVAQLSESLWATLSVLRTDSAYQSEHLRLPLAKQLKFDAAPAIATALKDDDSLQVSLEGIDGTLPFQGSARVDFVKGGKTYSLLSTSLALDTTARVLTITFPSPDKWGIPSDASAKMHFTPYCITQPDCPKIGDVSLLLVTGKDSSKSAIPNFSFASQSKRIVANHGAGSVTVAISKLKDDLATLAVDGADLRSATDESGKALAVGNGQVTITQNAVVTLQLTNLHVGDMISVTAEGKKSGKSTGKASLQWIVFGS